MRGGGGGGRREIWDLDGCLLVLEFFGLLVVGKEEGEGETHVRGRIGGCGCCSLRLRLRCRVVFPRGGRRL